MSEIKVENMKYMFSRCLNLDDIQLPSTLLNVYNDSFTGTTWYTNLVASSSNHVIIHDGILIDGSAASGSITIPNSVNIIASNAFKNIAGANDEIDVVVSYDGADKNFEKYKVDINKRNYYKPLMEIHEESSLHEVMADTDFNFTINEIEIYYI